MNRAPERGRGSWTEHRPVQGVMNRAPVHPAVMSAQHNTLYTIKSTKHYTYSHQQYSWPIITITITIATIITSWYNRLLWRRSRFILSIGSWYLSVDRLAPFCGRLNWLWSAASCHSIRTSQYNISRMQQRRKLFFVEILRDSVFIITVKRFLVLVLLARSSDSDFGRLIYKNSSNPS